MGTPGLSSLHAFLESSADHVTKHTQVGLEMSVDFPIIVAR
jgi:hypothetical protein